MTEPVRTCVGCRQEAGKKALVKVVRGRDGLVRVDASGKAAGRGAYLHATPECIASARKRRALERALGAAVGPDTWSDLAARS